MYNLQPTLDNYMNYCTQQKRLDAKTLKAYRIDLKQFTDTINLTAVTDITSEQLENFISNLHQQYKPKTVKRKIASLKAFFHYLEYREIIEKNPFTKLRIKFREPVVLPKTIPLHNIEALLFTIYTQRIAAKTEYQKRNALRDAAIIELLFASGMRISELCTLKEHDISLHDGTILIHGKGSKERILQIGTPEVLSILREYKQTFLSKIKQCGYFFVNQTGKSVSDQSIRRMINKYCHLAAIESHITPHMFRHTFATSLLEADVDIRYIQEMLGHSSINVTEIYTHVATAKKKDILQTKHPRKDFKITG